jgi:hypothetical protein
MNGNAMFDECSTNSTDHRSAGRQERQERQRLGRFGSKIFHVVRKLRDIEAQANDVERTVSKSVEEC